MGINSKNFSFDDEKGNNFNITVNHYHMTPQNPMSNLLNAMSQTAMMMSLMNNSSDELIEDKNQRSLPRNEILIEDKSLNGFSYEVHDIPNFDFIIKKMYDIEDYKVLELEFQKSILINEFENHYREICKSVQYKLTSVSDKTNKFIFSFNIVSLGEIRCAYVENDFFTCMLEKFGNGKRNLAFKHSIAEKLNVPFLSSLSSVDYIVDLNNIFYINFEAIDGKYHMKKEGTFDGY